jgi:hypothetical protein
MRLAHCLLNEYGPPATYIHVEGHRYVLVSHAADQMLAAIESAEIAERARYVEETERRS